MDRFYEALLEVPFGTILVTQILGLFLLEYYSIFVKVKKRKLMIFIGVVAITIFIGLMNVNLDWVTYYGLRLCAWEYLLVILEGVFVVILNIMITCFAVKNSSGLRHNFDIVICPHCGKWNEYEEVSRDDHVDNYYDCILRCIK